MRGLIGSPWTYIWFESGGSSIDGGENLIGKLAYTLALLLGGENSDFPEISLGGFLKECASLYIHGV